MVWDYCDIGTDHPDVPAKHVLLWKWEVANPRPTLPFSQLDVTTFPARFSQSGQCQSSTLMLETTLAMASVFARKMHSTTKLTMTVLSKCVCVCVRVYVCLSILPKKHAEQFDDTFRTHSSLCTGHSWLWNPSYGLMSLFLTTTLPPPSLTNMFLLITQYLWFPNTKSQVTSSEVSASNSIWQLNTVSWSASGLQFASSILGLRGLAGKLHPTSVCFLNRNQTRTATIKWAINK